MFSQLVSTASSLPEVVLHKAIVQLWNCVTSSMSLDALPFCRLSVFVRIILLSRSFRHRQWHSASWQRHSLIFQWKNSLSDGNLQCVSHQPMSAAYLHHQRHERISKTEIIRSAYAFPVSVNKLTCLRRVNKWVNNVVIVFFSSTHIQCRHCHPAQLSSSISFSVCCCFRLHRRC